MAVPEIEGYSALEPVAEGGFAVVYRAHHDRFDRPVAIKVFRDGQISRRFDAECRALGNLSWHPNVVAVYESGTTTDGRPFLAMEYLEAGSVADALHDGPLPWEAVVVIGIEVAGALGAAHERRTLHRDIKPENVLIGSFGEAQLGDFGIAAVAGDPRTATGRTVYSIQHVAPEVVGESLPDERSDLYSLASTLYTLINGESPFAGNPGMHHMALIRRVTEGPVPRLVDVPPRLADLLARTMAKDPAERPVTAEEFGRALQQVQRASGEPVTELRLARIPRPTRRPDPHDTVRTVPAVDDRATTDGDPPPSRGDARSTVNLRQPPPDRGDPRPTVDHRGPRDPPDRILVDDQDEPESAENGRAEKDSGNRHPGTPHEQSRRTRVGERPRKPTLELKPDPDPEGEPPRNQHPGAPHAESRRTQVGAKRAPKPPPKAPPNQHPGAPHAENRRGRVEGKERPPGEWLASRRTRRLRRLVAGVDPGAFPTAPRSRPEAGGPKTSGFTDARLRRGRSRDHRGDQRTWTTRAVESISKETVVTVLVILVVILGVLVASLR